MAMKRTVVLGGLVVVVAAAAAGGWFFYLQDDPLPLPWADAPPPKPAARLSR